MNKHISGLTITAASLILLSSCGNKEEKKAAGMAPAPVSVTLDTVKTGQVTGVDSYPGTVVALNEVELRAQVGGYITGIFIKDGQKVSKGQKLYEIDRTKYAAAYRQAQASVKIAKANRDKAKKDAERYTRLAEQDAIAKQRVDYALTDLQNAESQIAGAEANLANAAADLQRSIIYSPFSGTIGISQVKLGALVSPGTTLLNTVSTNDPIAVDIQISQEEIPRFNALQNSSSARLDSIFTIQLPDQSKYHLPGKIVAIDRAVDPQTGTIKVRVSYPNANGNLVAGMSCTINVLNKTSNSGLVIPFKAVTEQLGEFTVFVVGDSNKVEQRNVKLGLKVNEKVVINDGLKEGDVIAVDGVQNLKNGSVVQTGAPQPQPAKK